MYYGWFDDNPKLTADLKIQDAIDAYVRRFGKRPNVVLVNEADVVEMQGMAIRAESFIRRNNFWVGYEDANKISRIETAAPAAAAPAPEQPKRSQRRTAKLAA